MPNLPSDNRINDRTNALQAFMRRYNEAALNLIAARDSYDSALVNYDAALRSVAQAYECVTALHTQINTEAIAAITRPIPIGQAAPPLDVRSADVAERVTRGIMLSRIDSDSDTAAEQMAERERQYEP